MPAQRPSLTLWRGRGGMAMHELVRDGLERHVGMALTRWSFE
jgi:hypothetical protein